MQPFSVPAGGIFSTQPFLNQQQIVQQHAASTGLNQNDKLSNSYNLKEALLYQYLLRHQQPSGPNIKHLMGKFITSIAFKTYRLGPSPIA